MAICACNLDVCPSATFNIIYISVIIATAILATRNCCAHINKLLVYDLHCHNVDTAVIRHVNVRWYGALCRLCRQDMGNVIIIIIRHVSFTIRHASFTLSLMCLVYVAPCRLCRQLEKKVIFIIIFL